MHPHRLLIASGLVVLGAVGALAIAVARDSSTDVAVSAHTTPVAFQATQAPVLPDLTPAPPIDELSGGRTVPAVPPPPPIDPDSYGAHAVVAPPPGPIIILPDPPAEPQPLAPEHPKDIAVVEVPAGVSPDAVTAAFQRAGATELRRSGSFVRLSLPAGVDKQAIERDLALARSR